MRAATAVLLISAVVFGIPARAQTDRATVRFAGRTIDDWVTQTVADTSAVRRERIIATLRRAPAPIRAVAVTRLTASLADPSQDKRTRAIQALWQLGSAPQGENGDFDGAADLTPAIPTLVSLARRHDDPLSVNALQLLLLVSERAPKTVVPVAREALRDSSARMRDAGVKIVGRSGDSTDVPRLLDLLADRDEVVRGDAAFALGSLRQRSQVNALTAMLKDQSPYVRAMALRALANIGSTAGSALPAVAALITDTTHWRPGSYAETIGAEAAWTASRIMPRRGLTAIPARAEVDNVGSALRSDGFGPYVSGADSVDVFVAAALNLDLGGPRSDGMAAQLSTTRQLRRSLLFDLSNVVPGSGAKSLGLVRDNEAALHVFWAHEHQKRMISVTMLDPADTAVKAERVEFSLRIKGEPYLLQMGDWTPDEFNEQAPRIGGKGTSSPHLWHLTPDSWMVVSGPRNMARLWRISDPDAPVDCGLYYFPFSISWTAFVAR